MNATALKSLTAMLLCFVVCVSNSLSQESTGSPEAQEQPLTPVEARQQVGKEIVVLMKPAAIKDRLEWRGEIYIDSETNFRDEKNFAIVITEKGANRFKEIGIKDPAKHLENQEIRAKGVVKEVQGIPRIEINDPKQISIAEKAAIAPNADK